MSHLMLFPTPSGKSPQPHQLEAARRLREMPRALLGDDPGLGKTLSLLLALDNFVYDHNPLIEIVCPPVAIGVWQSEIAEWFGPDRFDVQITSWARWKGPRPGCTHLVVDEAHLFKHATSKRSRLMKSASAGIPYVWFATGTPDANSPADLWGMLDCMGVAGKCGWPTLDHFAMTTGAVSRHVTTNRWGGKLSRWHWYHRPVLPPSALDFIIRRKRDILQLPPLTESDLWLPFPKGARDLLDQALGLLGRLEHGYLEKSTRLAADRKLPGRDHEGNLTDEEYGMTQVLAGLAAFRAVQLPDLCEQYEGEPLVLFSAWRPPVVSFQDVPGWVTVTGDDPEATRTQKALLFQQGLADTRGFAGTMQSAGQSITLTRSAMVILAGHHLDPMYNDQARDRVLRMGQKRPVNAISVWFDHPADRRLKRMLDQKRKHRQETLV